MNHEHKETLAESGIDIPDAESYSKILDRSLWTTKEYLVICAA